MSPGVPHMGYTYLARASSNLSDFNLGLADMSLVWPAMVQLLVFITSHEPLFIDFYVFALMY